MLLRETPIFFNVAWTPHPIDPAVEDANGPARRTERFLIKHSLETIVHNFGRPVKRRYNFIHKLQAVLCARMLCTLVYEFSPVPTVKRLCIPFYSIRAIRDRLRPERWNDRVSDVLIVGANLGSLQLRNDECAYDW